MDIRFASRDDSKTLSALVLKASKSVRDTDFSDVGWELLKRTNTPEAFNERFNQSNYLCWLCEIEGDVSGYLAMIDYEKIDHMFVLPEYRRKGICKKLWALARKHCEDSGHGNYFWVRSSSYAEPVYKSFGFRPTGERKSTNGISFQFMELGENES